MVIRDSLLDFPLHPFLPFMVTIATLVHRDYARPAIRGFMVTMATPAGGQWVLTYPTDPYYPEFPPNQASTYPDAP
jgi:hypothetical protein